MGITWKFTMVLLSTLAALVIIVHSAEEDYENHYRRELRPRALDTGTRRYEQPWRITKAESIMQPTTPDSFIEDDTDEPPRRRRLGRKRKRRPEVYSSEEVNAHDRRYTEEPQTPQEEDRDSLEAPKRRKKKIERRFKWTDNFEEDRPIRRKGQRRIRPTIETWPELSEFGGFRPLDSSSQTNVETITDISETADADYNTHNADTEVFVERDNNKYNRPSQGKHHKHSARYNQDDISTYPHASEQVESDNAKTPKPLSEFSDEQFYERKVMSQYDKDNMKEKIKKNSSSKLREILKAHQGPINPLTLKDILKRSNGSSLSETLQQHNLSLTDLLHGKQMALSILKSQESIVDQPMIDETSKVDEQDSEQNSSSEEKVLVNSETKYVNDHDNDYIRENLVTTSAIQYDQEEIVTTETIETTTEKPKYDEVTRRVNIRRYPTGIRRKQRIRPMINTNYKSPLSRDLIALNARKYFNTHRRRNGTKFQDWRDVIPMKKNMTSKDAAENTKVETTTLYEVVEETTSQSKISEEEIVTTPVILEDNDETTSENPKENYQNETIVTNVEIPKPIDKTINTQQVNNSTGLRRQAFNNILKKKRRKQKYTTEAPQDDLTKNLFGIPNLVSSSEFIARTQPPKTSLDDVTILEDFIITQKPSTYHNNPTQTRITTTLVSKPITISTTEETAKIEIEEILNDTRASAKLSRILMERNMTLSELVEHRERGSSYVHLADIFHNTSKEPNPAEPFLSKSLIEPISKETYPLRALLDANIHDTTTKATTIDPIPSTGFVNIPVKMDFGSNVNENAENMGIMSLFHNITSNMNKPNNSDIMKDSEGSLYKTSITVVNASDTKFSNDSAREGRVVNVLNDNQDDIVSWNEIFSLMRKNYENKTKNLKDGLIPAESITKPTLEDVDGDGLIVLEDLQHLKDLETIVSPKTREHIEAHTNNNLETLIKTSGILDKIPNQTKSVTLATASIVGLAMVLFLLIYIGYKWRKQRCFTEKKHLADERIPTPVFENRKGRKSNSSTRSISPMLTSNIYTLSTLDSQNGKESPDYMWDSLRKPFQ